MLHAIVCDPEYPCDTGDRCARQMAAVAHAVQRQSPGLGQQRDPRIRRDQAPGRPESTDRILSSSVASAMRRFCFMADGLTTTPDGGTITVVWQNDDVAITCAPQARSASVPSARPGLSAFSYGRLYHAVFTGTRPPPHHSVSLIDFFHPDEPVSAQQGIADRQSHIVYSCVLRIKIIIPWPFAMMVIFDSFSL